MEGHRCEFQQIFMVIEEEEEIKEVTDSAVAHSPKESLVETDVEISLHSHWKYEW